MKYRHFYPRTALCAALLAAGLSPLSAQEVPSLGAITVSGSAATTPLNPGVAAEEEQLRAVAGGTNLIEPQKEVRLSTLKDALDYQPGIIVQEFFGGLDQPRLNIRGSGIQSNPVNRGVLLLQDGLPLNEADGSFIVGFLEPRNSSLISVRRGANAITPSATTLGGELDFQSFTGSAGDIVRVEGGSFGRYGVQAAKGLQGESLDGRLAVSYDNYDGYRHHSGSKRTSVQGNFGVLGDNFENRTYLSYVDLDVTIPTVVTRAHMEENPRWIMGDGNTPQDTLLNNYIRNPHRVSRQFRAANRSYWGSESLNTTLGFYAQNIDDTFQDPLTATVSDGMTYGAQWMLAGKSASLDYRVGLDWSRSAFDRDIYTVNRNTGAKKTHFGNYELMAQNINLLLGAGWHFTENWTMVADAKFSQAERNATDRFSQQTLNQEWQYASPRLGLIWEPNERLRLFANLARSNEAPTFWEIINNGAGATSLPNPMNDNAGTTGMSRLKVQRADTIELGGSGLLGAGALAARWDLALYYSRVRDELLSVSNANGTAAGTYNYGGRTIHRGVELGLAGSLPAPADGALDYRVAYNYSDFYFASGEYSGNKIAGVPRHLISAELLYRIGGLRAGPNVRWMPSSTPSTHANIEGTQQDSYAIFGFTVDYQYGKNWHAWLRADNLTDRTYASAFVIRNVSTTAAPTFLPGNGRSISAGLDYRF